MPVMLIEEGIEFVSVSTSEGDMASEFVVQ